MKKIIILTVALIFGGIFSANAQWGKTSGTLSSNDTKEEIKFEKRTIDLGKIRQYGIYDVTFKLTNTGSKPIIITQAKGTCGCTQIDYPKRPISAGKTVKINVSYEAEELGKFFKTVTLTMNIEDSSQKVFIKGEVVKK